MEFDTMQIVAKHSHLNGLEFLMVRSPDLWHQVEDIIAKVSDQSPKRELNSAFVEFGWTARLTGTNGPTFFKDRVTLEWLVKRSPDRSLWFAGPLSEYVQDEIDVGVLVLSMMAQRKGARKEQLLSYETICDALRKAGRTVPAVPLVLIGASR